MTPPIGTVTFTAKIVMKPNLELGDYRPVNRILRNLYKGTIIRKKIVSGVEEMCLKLKNLSPQLDFFIKIALGVVNVQEL